MFKKQLKDIKKYFKELPPNMVDQEESLFIKGRSCCFGAHLAYVLLGSNNYLDGAREFKDRLGIKNDVELLLLFAKAGLDKTINPFDSEDWNLPVLEVIKNLEKIKKIPDTEGADLGNVDLAYSDLNYINLKYANLSNVKLRCANLIGASLRGANLKDTNLRCANLENADLAYANLENADLQCTKLLDLDLGGADLRCADLRYANLGGANLKGAILCGASFPKEYNHLLSEYQKKQVAFI